MKLNLFIAGICLGAASVASSQPFTDTTQTTQIETSYVTVDGEVIRYDAGKVIVVQGADNKEVTYTLAPTVVVPADIQVGRRVTLYTEPGPDGKTQLVSRVTTTSVTSEGNIKRTTEDTRRLPSGVTTKTTTTSMSGKVEAYEMGKTLTILRSDGSKATYLLNKSSKVPAGLVIGKSVSIEPVATGDSEEPVARTVTYVTTTKTTTKTETVPAH